MTDTDQHPWGRVDETGTVFVRDGGAEREIGQFPDGSPEEALAYFERKYTDLVGQVTLLEQRTKAGAPAPDVSRGVVRLRATIDDAHAVGDLAALRSRLDALSGTVSELTEQQKAEARQSLADALAERAAIVDEVERLAAVDPAKTQWKQASTQLDDLFARWQSQQQEGPRLPKSDANDLWKRFRAARTIFETNRRAFFAELDSAHRDVRTRKQDIIARAETLAPRGAEGVDAYRGLLDEWKNAGRAGKKQDDALWARFKAAGDVLYGAKAERDAQDDVEYRANLDAKLALLEEAAPLAEATDYADARIRLASIQRRWDEVGRVPRESVRRVEDRMRSIEASVRTLEQRHWERSDPEKQARSAGLAGQLHDAITQLEEQLEVARQSGDSRAIADAEEALAARRAWLTAIG